MCQYDDPDFQTVWSSVFDLKTIMIYRAEGDPRKKKFGTDDRLHKIVKGRKFLSILIYCKKMEYGGKLCESAS